MAKTFQSAAKQMKKTPPNVVIVTNKGGNQNKVSKQGRLDPSKPMNQLITLYTPETPPFANRGRNEAAINEEDEDVEDEQNEDEQAENEEENDVEVEEEEENNLEFGTVLPSTIASKYAIGIPGRNVIIKNT